MDHMAGYPEIPEGLRERKKVKTRETIRREALRLFEEQGYPDTTVEQISAAAEVSPSTFFRYFTNKAAVLMLDDDVEPIIERFLRAPPELSPIAAYRHAVLEVLGAKPATTVGSEDERQRLLYTLPEAAGALYNQYVKIIELIAAALAVRLNRPGDDPQLRVAAGAITGVFIATLHGTPMDPDIILPALDFLDAGLPLT